MNRKLYISLGIIAALVFILLLANRTRTPDVPGVNTWKGSADEILIVKGDSRIRLYRDNERWLVNDSAYPADREAVHEMENKLKNLSITDLISEKPHYERYELSPEKSVEVSVKKGGEVLLRIFIGKKSPTSRHTYVRMADLPAVYLASGPLSDDFNKSLDDVRDKEIVKIGRREIQSLDMVYKGRRLTFSKIMEEKKSAGEDKPGKTANAKETPVEKTEKWICNEYKNTVLDDNQVDQVLNSLDPLKAASFPPMEKKDLKAPLCSVKIKTHNTTVELGIHQKIDENKYICVSSESKYLFALEIWKAEKFMKTIEDLKKK